jgi:hypothetical protein
LPSEDKTPPVMKINLVLDLGLDVFMGGQYNRDDEYLSLKKVERS